MGGPTVVRSIALVAFVTLNGCSSITEPLKVVLTPEVAEASESRPTPAHRPIPPSGQHVVAAGETLWGIANVYRVDIDELAHANEVEDAHHIEVGEVLDLRWPLDRREAIVPRRAPPNTSLAVADEDAAPPPLRVVMTPTSTTFTPTSNSEPGNNGSDAMTRSTPASSQPASH